tara:strand:+ start:104 stop:259 length:156 start_codon:yes stop_codon:yes gene_type:complete
VRTLTFLERYFKDKDEWNYFLSELGIRDKDTQDEISEIEITVDGHKVTDKY